MTPVAYAFLLTAIAGLCTGVGSLLAFFTHRTNRSFLAVSMGFSAGVMLYVSMVEILPKGRVALAAAWGEKAGSWAAVLAFFGGVFLVHYMSDAVFGLLFASVAGIMVFISLDQLLPTAEKHGEHHLCTYGLVAGMALMAVSLLLFLK